MGFASSSTTSHTGHDTPAGPHTFPPIGSKPSRAEVAALEFSMFAETLRQDLAPLSLLEHVLAERVVLASWRLHGVSLEEANLADLGGSLDPVSPESRRADCALKSALILLQSARKAQHPRSMPKDDAELDVRIADRLPAEQADDEDDNRFDALSADVSNEWPFIAEDSEDRECFDPADVEESADANLPVRWQDRLVFDFNVSETSPVVKGTWVTVGHVVSLIVDGWSWSDVLRAHPELTEEDVRTCLAYTVEQDDRGEY
jgi:uncharacterized protein (DUF433 family)